MQLANHVQVHRFRDECAVSFRVEGAPTIYMSKEMAAKLAKTLLKCAKDIENNHFAGSEFDTVELTSV